MLRLTSRKLWVAGVTLVLLAAGVPDTDAQTAALAVTGAAYVFGEAAIDVVGLVREHWRAH